MKFIKSLKFPIMIQIVKVVIFFQFQYLRLDIFQNPTVHRQCNHRDILYKDFPSLILHTCTNFDQIVIQPTLCNKTLREQLCRRTWKFFCVKYSTILSVLSKKTLWLKMSSNVFFTKDRHFTAYAFPMLCSIPCTNHSKVKLIS